MSLRDVLIMTPGVTYEVLVSTVSVDGAPNVAPMGVIFEEDLEHFILKPYVDTMTYRNLKATGVGVLNITRDPEPFVLGCLSELRERLFRELEPSRRVDALRLQEAEAYIEFRVERVEVKGERAVVRCAPIEAYLGRVRVEPYTRAACALVEAAVSASRLRVFLRREARLIELLEEIERAGRIIKRTGAGSGFEALMELLTNAVKDIIG